MQEEMEQKQEFEWLLLARWLLLVVGIAGAIWVQLNIHSFQSPSQAGLLLLAASLIVIVVAPGPLKQSSDVLGRSLWLGVRTASLGGGVTLLLAAGATYLLWQDMSSGLGLFLWVAAIIALRASFWNLRPVVPDAERIRFWFPVARQPTGFAIPWQIELFLLLLIIAGAVAVRVWDLSLFPNGLQSDEGNNGMEALKWLSGAPYTPYSEANEGQASLFTYLIALAFSIFGPSLEAMRSVSAVVGVLTVGVLYLLARDHLTVPGALASAAFLAFSRWHITFSRIIYELILTPLAVILLFYFLHRGLRDRRMRDFVLAGLALAFGLNTYTGFRTVPIGIGLLFVYWLIVRWRQAGSILGGGLLMGASGLVGLIPLGIYAIQRPDVVLLRTRRLNLLGEIDAVGTLEPLWTNLRNYLLMFNLRGDPVAINNLPGEPALAAVLAALAVVGCVYALRHLSNPRMALALAWVAATLPAGILSVTLESPSSRRVIGIVPLACLLAAIVIDIFWRQSVRTWRGHLRWLWAGVLVAVVTAASYADVRLLFTTQLENHAVQMAFSPVESAIARYIAKLNGQADIYLNQNFRSHSAIQFIARNPEYSVLDMALHLPLPQPSDRPVIYVLTTDDSSLRFLFDQYYPQGVWEEQRTEFGVPLFNTFTVSPQQQRNATGLLAVVTQTGAWENATGPEERTEGIALPAALPVGETGVVWRGSLRVPVYGSYTFGVAADGPVSLLLDGVEILAGTGDALPQTHILTSGFHAFSLAADVSASVPPSLWWRGPVPEGPIPNTAFFAFPTPRFGLTGVYFANANWEGAPVQVQQDVVVASTDALVSPYSVVWTGQIQIDNAGVYRFGTTSDDGSFVYVDGQLAVDNGGQHGAEYKEGPPLELDTGKHTIEIRYFQDGGSHKFELYWSAPTSGRTLVPPDRLFADGTDLSAIAAPPVDITPAAQPSSPSATAAPIPELPTATPVPVPASPLQTPAPMEESESPLPTVTPATD